MAREAVYCVHIWATHGPDVLRCQICTCLWYKFKDPKEPVRIIGYLGGNPNESPTNPTEE